ncbi:hypothetical protein BBJ28_00007841 [Nothophytophthora sp. Chile5]|nr:hypothetical protein BBJ28_00007841 [Nothophytophthora sp. Chile5]
MDAILARVGVSEAQLRLHCLSAVQDEMEEAEARLQAALAALKRVLEVVHASQELHKSPVALVDASPLVAALLTQLVSSSNEIGPLVRKLHREVSSSAAAVTGDPSLSSTEDEEEPEELPVELDAADHWMESEQQEAAVADALPSSPRQTVKPESSLPAGVSETPVLPASPASAGANRDDNEANVADRPVSSPPQNLPTRTSAIEESSSTSDAIIETSAARSTIEKDVTSSSLVLPPSRWGRKRKAPDRYLTPLLTPEMKKPSPRDLLTKTLALTPNGRLGEAVRPCLVAAKEGHIDSLVCRMRDTCRTLVNAHNHGDSVEPYMDDVRLVLTVAVPGIANSGLGWERAELNSLLMLVQQLPRQFSETTKLRRFIAATYQTPADETGVIREHLGVMLVEDMMEALSYEGYEPHRDKTIAELLFLLECCLGAFMTGWSQDRRYDTIRALLSKMKSGERRGINTGHNENREHAQGTTESGNVTPLDMRAEKIASIAKLLEERREVDLIGSVEDVVHPSLIAARNFGRLHAETEA